MYQPPLVSPFDCEKEVAADGVEVPEVELTNFFLLKRATEKSSFYIVALRPIMDIHPLRREEGCGPTDMVTNSASFSKPLFLPFQV